MRIVKNIQKLLYLFSFYWKAAKGYFILTLLVELIIVPCSTYFNLNIIRLAVDGIANGQSFSYVLKVICFNLLVIFLLKVLYDIHAHCTAPRNTKIIDDIKKRVYDKVLHTDYKYIDDPNYFDNYCWTVDEFADYVISSKNAIVSFLISLTNILVIVSMMSTLSIALTLIIVLSIVVSTVISSIRNKAIYKQDEKLILPNRRTAYAHKIFYWREFAADIKCNRAGGFTLSEYEKASVERFSILKSFVPRKILFSVMDNLNINITNLLIMLYLAFDIIFRDLSIGNFSVLFSASWTLKSSISSLLEVFICAQSYSFYVDRLSVFMDTKSIIESQIDREDLIVANTEKPFKIDLYSASFKYANSNFGIKNIDLHIPAGHKVAIVGENGSGKTTLIKLLLRLYDFDSGRYTINDEEIKRYDIKQLRLSIGTAFQNPVIYAFSLKDNIKLYKEVSDKEIYDVIESLELTPIITKSGADINSDVTKEFSEDGLELSGGEMQKIGLARTHVGDFGLLLLDEPSSMLDPLAEAKLNDIIWSLDNKATTIVISHRLSSVVGADEIYFMKKGEIVERGTHNELMNKRGLYYTMFETQAKNYRT